MPATDISARPPARVGAYAGAGGADDSEAETELGADSPHKRRPGGVIDVVRPKRAALATDNEREDSGDEELASDGAEGADDRAAAVAALGALEIDFARLKDDLYAQRVARIDLEIALLADDVHPELTFYRQQIAQKRDDQLRRLRALGTYRVNALLAQSHASKCHALETFAKNRAGVRAQLLGQVTHEWFKINQEVRERHDQESRLEPPPGPPDRKHRALRAIAPGVACATSEEVSGDMHEIGIL